MKGSTRWLPRALVVFTVLICLGVGGYAGQVWVVRMSASDAVERGRKIGRFEDLQSICGIWRKTPWYGFWFWDGEHGWWPRRSHYEILKMLTGLDLGNDPAAWEAWIKAHPNLVWDEKRKQLVDAPPTPE